MPPHAITTPGHSHHGHCARVEKGPHALGGGDALALRTGSLHLRCVRRRKGDMEDAGIEGALHRKATRRKDLQHAIILAQHIRLEGVDPLPPGYGGQMFEEERAHAAPLMGIRHGKRHLRARGGLAVLLDPKIAAHTDDVLLLPCLERRDEGHIPREVQFSKVAQLFVGEALFGLEKAKIDGPAAQALEQVEEALLVVGPDRSDVDGATITQECVRGIVARFCHTHHRPPWRLTIVLLARAIVQDHVPSYTSALVSSLLRSVERVCWTHVQTNLQPRCTTHTSLSTEAT